MIAIFNKLNNTVVPKDIIKNEKIIGFILKLHLINKLKKK